MSEKLFVYGTLAPGRANAHLLEEIGGRWERASILGILHPQGWGAALGYPGVVLDDTGGEVPGYLFVSEGLSDHWEQLDEFEGEGYERVVARARREDGSLTEAWVYELTAAGLP